MRVECLGPELTFRARLATEDWDMAGREKYLDKAAKLWPAPRVMSDWALSWFATWAQEVGDGAASKAAADERRRRKTHPEEMRGQGELPAAMEPD